MPTHPEYMGSSQVYRVRVSQSLVLCVLFCRSLFVLLAFVIRPLHLQFLITYLISSNFSYPPI